MSSETAEGVVVTPGAIDESNLTRSVIRLAWPVVVQQVSFSMVQLVDTALVGHLGEDALAGVRLGGQIFWFAQAGMVAVGVGSTAIIARNVGAGNAHLASRTLQNAILMAFLWGMAVGVAMWFLGNWGLGALGAEPGARHEGTTYLKATAVGMPFWSMVFAGNASQQGAGDTTTPMMTGIVINVANIIIAYTLINGAGPAPRLDVLGSGAGFTGAAIIGCVLVLSILALRREGLHWRPSQAFRLHAADARRVLNVGIPAGVEQAQFNIAFMIYTRIIASLGTTALAAHGVTLAIQSLTFNVGFALSVATSALVGQSLGAKKPEVAERAAWLTTRYSLIFMSAMGLAMIFLGRQITDLFVGGEKADEVVDIGAQLLFIFAFALPGIAVSLCLGGALRGAGDTRIVLFIMAGSTWIVRLVPAYVLAITLGMGVPGAWLAAILDINVRSLLMFLRFRQGKWKEIAV
ncbi:MAG TPA: MATE family efflux transporter [Dehalococcoidia bacterium]|nr:MATE family efflux transporter [Dehalococcoidia bacterium]